MTDFSAEILYYYLMAEADAEYGQFVLEVINGRERDAGGIRSAGTGRDYQQVGGELFSNNLKFLQRGIGTVNTGLTIAFAEVIDQVSGVSAR
jgi:hypothetical protein